uniref:Uncharacterized protein n=1 Tax=Anguilla anguilla TaxID=7936 RepID=A0A0E9PZW6_ANGAN
MTTRFCVPCASCALCGPLWEIFVGLCASDLAAASESSPLIGLKSD